MGAPVAGRRWPALVAIGLGLVLIVGAVVWRAVAVPALVRFPDDLDEHPRYEGRAVFAIDPVTQAPLSSPKVFPLVVERRVMVDRKQTTKELAVVDETLKITITGLGETTTSLRYVMDRRSMRNVDDPRAYAYVESNVAARGGSYRLNLPLDAEPQPYPIWANEIGETFQIEVTDGPATIEGLDVVNLRADEQTPKPIVPQYVEVLSRATPLPPTLTLEKFAPLLASRGIDVPALAAVLLPKVSEADRAVLLGLLTTPVKVQYLLAVSGTESVEPSTGAIVEVRDVTESLTSRPEEATSRQLVDVLNRYPNVPEAVDAASKLRALQATPIKIADFMYSQTPASRADGAETIKDFRSQIRVAQTVVPLGSLIPALVLVVVGGVLFGRAVGLGRRRTSSGPDEPVA